MKDPNAVYCEHMEKDDTEKEYPYFFSLGNKRYLLMCEKCGLAIQGIILAGVVRDGVKDFLRERKTVR